MHIESGGGLRPEMHGWFFNVKASNFSLGVTCDGNRVILSRNSFECSIDLAPVSQRKGKFLLRVIWSQELLALTVYDSAGQRRSTIQTPKLAPPNSLTEFIRRNALAPQDTYDDRNAFFEEVVSQLQILTDRIYANNAFDQFWDTIREGNRIVARKPKREVEIHSSIKLLLDALEIQRGWNIAPESPLGSGKLDFLITGRLTNGNSSHVCVEFKLAHADDLAHGLFTQLPQYMDKKATDYGIYCVVNFGGDYAANVNQFGIPEFTDPECSLELVLPVAANNTGKTHVRALIIDVSKQPPPSKA